MPWLMLKARSQSVGLISRLCMVRLTCRGNGWEQFNEADILRAGGSPVNGVAGARSPSLDGFNRAEPRFHNPFSRVLRRNALALCPVEHLDRRLEDRLHRRVRLRIRPTREHSAQIDR